MRCRAAELDSIAGLAIQAREAAVRIDANFMRYLIDMVLIEVGQQIAAIERTFTVEQPSGTCPNGGSRRRKFSVVVSKTRIAMNVHDIERAWAGRANRYLSAELERAGVTGQELAARLKAAGWEETHASIAHRLVSGTFDAAFFLACLECLEMDGKK